MATHERRSDRAAAMSRRLRMGIGDDIRLARREAGLSLRFVAAAVGCSPATLSRLERGLLVSVSVDLLVRVAVAVGLDLSMRSYPGGQALRDQPQVALHGELRTRLHASLAWALEVGLPIPRDQRRWDAVISGQGWGIAVEAESAPRDWQALVGRIGLKQRDGNMPHVILLLPESHRTTEFLRAAESLVAGTFPVPGRVALARLARGEDPGGSSIIVLRAPGRRRTRDVSRGSTTNGTRPAGAMVVAAAATTNGERPKRDPARNEERVTEPEWIDLRSL